LTPKHQRVLAIVAVGLVVALLFGTAGFALAQGAGGSNPLGDFLGRVAAKLGIQKSDLEGAIVQVEKEMLDEAVQAGKLSQDRAGAIKKRLDEGKIGPFPFLGGLGAGVHRGRIGAHQGWKGDHWGGKGFDLSGRPGRALAAESKALAQFLGMTPEELKAALRSGKSVAQVAQEKGKSRDELKDFLTTRVLARLDQAVKDGKLTQEKGDQIKAKILQKLENWIDRALKPQ